MKHSMTVTWHGLALQLDIDGALYWPEERLLVAADLHLEKGNSYASSAGRLLPPYDSAQTVARLERLIEAYRPLRVVALAIRSTIAGARRGWTATWPNGSAG